LWSLCSLIFSTTCRRSSSHRFSGPPQRPAFTEVGIPVKFSGEAYTFSEAELSATDVHRLFRPLGSLRDYEYEFRRALDRLFTGF
jgi:hypothetical protein